MFITVFRPLLLQTGAVGLAALAGGMFGEVGTALALLYGGAVSVANTALLIWRWHRGARDFHCDADKHLRSFYRSMLERFLVVVILLAAGLARTELPPLSLLAGFVVGQVAWMLASLTLRERT
jgi:ATP synthase protein I